MDEAGKEAFITNNPLQILRKVHFCVYVFVFLCLCFLCFCVYVFNFGAATQLMRRGGRPPSPTTPAHPAERGLGWRWSSSSSGGGGIAGSSAALMWRVWSARGWSLASLHVNTRAACLPAMHMLSKPNAIPILPIATTPMQALLLRRISVYFDTDAEFWQLDEGASWRALAPHDWDDWFLPGVRWGCRV